MRRCGLVLGVLVAFFALVGCAPGAPASSGSTPVTVAIAIELSGGTVKPNGQTINVAKGATVTLTITSDRDDTVHVHGYDIEVAIAKGGTATRSFTADKVGRYEIESHSPAMIIAMINVR